MTASFALSGAVAAQGRRAGAVCLALGVLIAASACGARPAGSEAPAAQASAPRGAPETIVEGLSLPWAAVFIGEEVLVSERDTGTIWAFTPGGPLREVGRLPSINGLGDGGLLGLAALNQDGEDWVYAFYTGDTDNRIVRMTYSGGQLGAPLVVLAGIPSGRGHNGGRIAFGPDGMLYATTGETRQTSLSQDPASLAGKILRLTPEGTIPSDNPDPASFVYALGLRNPQGLAWDNSNRLWATDFGDDGWDELNLIEPGANYGWPLVEGRGENPAYVNPVVQWRTQEAGPSGLAFVDGALYVAGLTGQRIWAVRFDARGAPLAEAHFEGAYGRIRDVFEGNDGRLWFLTSNEGNRRVASRTGGDRILSVPLTRSAAEAEPG